ncbi:putative membrane protein YphA (DoxX/SURF4 family) [Pontibacter aydingkolensis]|uniref:SH3 domain-containing protein n=1 Tax=Pontibacter aydingkolensis TaxID=1911536 RepID=A0ABS7CUN0_9BACT|nr:SH3 domain-containing protein [Pontibacter aydingkolensis]MBW7467473.1 SH3 domain-containing protein [Pontibacter aydingkolensis]
MQNLWFKISAFVLVFLTLFAKPAYSQADNSALIKADSLFLKQHYSEALGLYEDVLHNQQVYSPQMLLKMAYIKEGLRDYTGAMYYLHMFYTKEPSRSTLKKMEELAQAHRLQGYEYNDLQFFKTQFNKHYMRILELMLLAAVVSVTIMFFSWRKGHRFSKQFKIGFILYLLFILYYINFLNLGDAGIIRNNNVAIMSAPSAGASWLATASQGHKVPITGEQDIWFEIRWKGSKAYIRKSNLLELP